MPRTQRLVLIAAIASVVGYAWLRGAFVSVGAAEEPPAVNVAGTTVATFAAGCFWSAESAFEGMPGVVAVTAGYTGGIEPNPTYDQVSAGTTGHAEAVEVRFDPARVSYAALLDRFWREVDPFTDQRQFCDRGAQYRPVVFVHDAAQRDAAVASRTHWEEHFGERVRVAVEDARQFFHAEGYHQDYATRNLIQYRFYRWSCGRDARLREIWGTNDQNVAPF